MGFQVLVPGTPKIEPQTVQTPNGPVKMDKFTVRPKRPNEFYMVICIQCPADVDLAGRDKLLEAGRQDLLQVSKGQIRNQASILLNGWPGFELEFSNDNSFIKARILATKDKLYEVVAWVPKIRSQADDIPKFLNSFKVPERQSAVEPD